jgi:hypothetical protein
MEEKEVTAEGTNGDKQENSRAKIGVETNKGTAEQSS